MKKIIGLIPLYDDERESYWMLPGYMKMLENCGACPVMLPLTKEPEELKRCFSLCDGLLLTGGHDVNPALYGEQVLPQCGLLCPVRDEMEGILLKLAMAADMPVLGICRGIQFMNVWLGGSLYQDLQTQFPTNTEHHMAPPYDREAHKISVLEHTMLAELIGAGEHSVNSYHHQAIKDLAPCATAMAVSEDGLVEALCVPGKRFMVGIQWHPEFSYEKNNDSRRMVQAFVDA